MSSPASSGAEDVSVSPVSLLVGDLHAFERLLRSALAASGKLTISTAEAQVARVLSPIAGHQVFAGISAAQVSVSDALSQVAKAHRQLEILAEQLGIDITGYGETKPPSNPMVFFTTGEASPSANAA